MSERPDVFAFYLPQFYPIPHNDTWWGEGFTEWNTLLQAQRGYRAPREARLTPGSLGFYDERLTDTRAAQGKLARDAGLAAFAVYHYWSLGDRVMPEVVDRMLADGEPDLPFFFCWANHHWTRAWAGEPDQITWEQQYEELGDDRHIDWLLEAFADPRYYRIGTAPVMAVYDVQAIPHAREVFARWRERVRTAGFSDLVIIGMAAPTTTASPADHALDAWVQSFSGAVQAIPAWRRALGSLKSPSGAYQFFRRGDYRLQREVLDANLRERRRGADADRIPQVVSGWNNVGRRSSRAWSMAHDPDAFATDLADALKCAPSISSPDGERRLVCVNAWNEWGEGMAMEPSVELGSAMLERLSRALT
ncbi:glycosyltransferase WbsX family protein [Nocardia sp. N13]|uniref:glycosyltransferase WbsX family protein n=1 Tax=Nocardioides sp. N13(2025) TaxID=3453405 RepID=UPI003F76AD09